MMTRRSLFAKAAATGAALALVGTRAALAGGAEKKGTFEGRSNHVTSGSVKLVKDGGRYIVELGDDFSLDGGPDPRVAFGKDGTYAPDTKLGALLNLTGSQSYAVPPTMDVSGYNEVYIWCEVAGVPLGVASLK
ncbi:DM13 domain-containing protein [Ruegeria marisrubri]|uniref:DM13 domain-containing protein n=1 Tax=Ruegeria marisrubri TaxID=1685379 RepID=UPI001CD7ECF0|nr:DM13 domain-containing protein [Ruegeria marisrubri]MCA0908101.1 DM13 domain-containing protein [Ruegeria marisrubri]